MANTIRHKRNSTASAIPTSGSLLTGELAVNTADGRLFLKKDDNTIVRVGQEAAGSNTQIQFNNSGVLGADNGLVYDSANEILRVRSDATNYFTIGAGSGGESEVKGYGKSLIITAAASDVTINALAGSVVISSPAVLIDGKIDGTNTTASTSSTTGAVIVAGGVGIAKDSFINGHRIGQGLLQDTTNLAVGANALQATIAGGTLNTAIGSGCGSAITSGNKNTLLGYAVGTLVTTGVGNCSIGYSSLKENTVGNYNTAMGYGALQNTTADFNTAVGLEALFNITTGALNTAIGRQAGCFQADGTTALTTANNSVYLGRDTRGTQSDSNSIVIGYQAIGLGANTTVIGTSSTTAATVYGALSVPSTTASTSSTTGALIVAGGAGFAKDSFVNGLRVGIGGTGAGLVTSNAAFGKDALTGNTGTATVGIGENAGYGNTGTANCVFIGQDSGVSNTGGSTLGIGTSSMYQNTGSACVGVGTNALFHNSGHHSVAIGYDALFSNNGDHCVAIGYATLAYNGIGNQGVSNTAIGYFAGNVNSTGVRSTFIGRDAGVLNTTGSDQVFIGSDAGDICTTGTQNTVLGSQADLAANNDNNSIVIGYNAVGLGSNTTVIGTSSTTAATVYGALSVPSTTASTSSTTGAVIVAGGVGIAKDSYINGHRIGQGLLASQTNLAVGANTLASTIAGGIDNVAVGYYAGSNITTGSSNVMLGSFAGQLNTTGQSNMCIGNGAHYSNQAGSYNVAIGAGAGHEQNNASVYNLFLGTNSGYWMTSGNNNVCLGGLAGVYHANGSTNLTASSDSVYIGYNAKGFNNSDSNTIVIGSNAIGLGANKTVIGTSSTTETKLFGQLTLDATACISAASATSLALKTVVPAGTGVTPTIQIICPSAAFALQNVNTTQAVFNTPVDTISLQAATTYMFEGQYLLQTGTTSHTTTISFVSSIAITPPSIAYTTIASQHSSPNASNNTQTTSFFTSIAGGIVATAATLPNMIISFKGIIRATDAGNLVPNILFSVAPGVAANFTLIGSYIKFYPIGANTIDSVGTAIG